MGKKKSTLTTIETKPTITLICRTSADDVHSDYEYASLCLDLDLVMELLKLISIAAIFKATDETFHRVSFFRAMVGYFREWRPRSWLGELVAVYEDLSTKINDDCQWALVPSSYRPPCEDSRVDAPSLAVDEDSVIFHCYPHGGSCSEIETQVLTKDELADYANELMRLQIMATVADRPAGREARAIQLDR